MKATLYFLCFACLSALSACGPVGRCTNNSQCPVGEFCQLELGLCSPPPTSGADQGGATGTGSTAAALPANYGRSCEGTDTCADVAGTTCNGSLFRCLATCRNSPSECGAGASCVQGICLEDCTADSQCGATNFCGGTTPSGPSQCWPKFMAASKCTANEECASGYCDTTKPGGFCVQNCTNDVTLCGFTHQPSDVNVCVKNSTGAAYCFERCATPGTTSNCRSGFQCLPLSGVSYGFCRAP